MLKDCFNFLPQEFELDPHLLKGYTMIIFVTYKQPQSAQIHYTISISGGVKYKNAFHSNNG